MVVLDTNILVRCVRGRAMRRVRDVIDRGVLVATTDFNAKELWRTLTLKLRMDANVAIERVNATLAVIGIIGWDQYAHLKAVAEARLGEGGKDDWPALAAAMALEAAIWTDDTDFFGVGVPVWSTPNVHLAPADRQE